MYKPATATLILLIALGSFFLVNGWLKSNPVIELDAVEIQNYEGQDLSSVNDFRENSIKGPQNIDVNSYQLEVTGLVANPQNFSYNQLTHDFTSYQKVVTLNCVEGWSVTILWQGLLVSDLMKEVQPSSRARTVIFYAADGYSTSFPIGYFENNQIIMAYKMNNATILPQRGFPLVLVAEDKWGYKWIKWITKIEFSDDVTYEGYWESRGFSNSGNLNESFFK